MTDHDHTGAQDHAEEQDAASAAPLPPPPAVTPSPVAPPPVTPPLFPPRPVTPTSEASTGWPSAPVPPYTRTPEPAPQVEPAPQIEVVELEPVSPAEADEPVQVEPVAELPDGAPAPLVTPEHVAEPAADPEPESALESEPEPEAEQEPAAALDAQPVPSGSQGVLLPVLAGLVVVLLGLTGFLGWSAQRTAGAAPVETSRTEALSAAREAARLVFSYDYRHLAKDFAAGKAVTTGDFAQEYTRTTGKLVDDVAPRYKAVVAADVSEASVVRATTSQVVCLVFVNQSSTSTLSAAPKVTQSRLEMTMTHVGGRWLVSAIDAL